MNRPEGRTGAAGLRPAPRVMESGATPFDVPVKEEWP